MIPRKICKTDRFLLVIPKTEFLMSGNVAVSVDGIGNLGALPNNLCPGENPSTCDTTPLCIS